MCTYIFILTRYFFYYKCSIIMNVGWFEMKIKILENSDIRNVQNAMFLKQVVDVEILKWFIQDSSSFAFIAVEDSEVVGLVYGYILFKPFSNPMFYIHSVDVKQEYQGQGIGTNMIEQCIDYAKKKNCYKGFIITNKENVPANKLYQKTGASNPYEDDIVYEFQLWSVSI